MTPKRGNNEGSIYFAESVKLYPGVVTLPDGRRKYVSARTRKGCADKLQAVQAQLAAGLPAGDTDRLGPFLDWWLGTLEAKAASGTKSVNTVDNAAGSMRKWVTPALGGRRLRELEPEDVEAVLAAMVTAGKGRRTVARVRSYLGRALAVAERRGKLARNVARISEMPETRAPAERRALTPEPAGALLVAATGHRLEGLFVAGLMLGLRPGELTGLRWTDIVLEAAGWSWTGR